jgi:hypothetical protein
LDFDGVELECDDDAVYGEVEEEETIGENEIGKKMEDG